MSDFRGLPWVVDGANDWLAENISADWSVLEYGSGSSTIWFSPRVASVLSVEHNPLWKLQVAYRCGPNVKIAVRERPYAWFPLKGRFDFVLVDGRDRVRCVTKARDRVKPGGVLMLDNSERTWYSRAWELMEGWELLGDVEQVGPDRCGFCYPG